MSLSKRDSQVIWHPYTQMYHADPAIAIVKGEGVYLEDENGNKYIDAISSWWVNLHGHAHPYIAEKVSAQLHKLEHVIFAGFTHSPAIELAEGLIKILPSNQSKIFYSDNGSTAVEVAVKMAMQYWQNKGTQKIKFIAFESSYHGDTFGAMSVSARSAFTKSFSSLLFDVIYIPVPVTGRESDSLAAIRTAIENNKDIAAFIFEPLILGAGGMLMHEPEILNELIQLCKENNILTIADEVMTGFGRTGKNFASDYLQQQPDIMCLSKGLTGGTMAMGVTSCSIDIYNAFLSDDRSHTFYHGHSYTANPLACRAAIASMELLITDSCQRNIQRICKQQIAFVNKIQNHPSVKNARSKGTIMAFEFSTQESSSYFNSIRDHLYEYFLSEGILLRPLGNTVYIMPPYCISEEELSSVHKVIEKKLDLPNLPPTNQ